MKKIISNICLIVTAMFLAVNNSYAENIGDEKEAESFINDFGNKIIKITGNEKYNPDKKVNDLISLIDTAIDADWIAKFVLGRHYRTASAEQKEQFKKLYREFMINTYGPKFRNYKGERFEIKSVANQNKYFAIKSFFYPKKPDPAVSIEFRVKKRSDSNGYLILDIIAEGVSLIETQRSEFGSVIATDGMDKFMQNLQERIKRLKAENSGETGAKASATAKKK